MSSSSSSADADQADMTTTKRRSAGCGQRGGAGAAGGPLRGLEVAPLPAGHGGSEVCVSWARRPGPKQPETLMRSAEREQRGREREREREREQRSGLASPPPPSRY